MSEGLELFEETDTLARRRTYQLVADQFQIETAFYPGSGADIAPSLFIPHVVYLDNFPLISDFFQDRTRIIRYINKEKAYPGLCEIEYYRADYHCPPDLPQFDLLLSQYAGNVGQELKRYLKPGGILLVADGPEDARLAMCDMDYELVGTIQINSDRAEILPGIQLRQFQLIDGADIDCPRIDPIKVPLPRNFCFKKNSR